MKTRKLILIGTLFILVFSAQAQRKQGFPDIEKMHQNKWEFMVKEVQLTAAEQQAVRPVFMEYEKNVWKLHRQIHEIFKNTKGKKLAEKEYKELNDRIINLQIKETQLLRSYHLKLSKMLEPEKLFGYYHAEKKFRMQLLRKRPPRTPQKDCSEVLRDFSEEFYTASIQ